MDPRIAYIESVSAAYENWFRMYHKAALFNNNFNVKTSRHVEMDNSSANFIPIIPHINCKPNYYMTQHDQKKKRDARLQYQAHNRFTNIPNHKTPSQRDDAPQSLGNAPWKRKPQYAPGTCGLHEEIKDFYHYMEPLEAETRMRLDVVERIRAVVKSLWSSAEVDVYGSTRHGLFLPTSDIDLAVYGKWEELPLHTLEQALINEKITDKNGIKVLDKTYVPIIKLTDLKSKAKVDISFNQSHAVRSAQLIMDFIEKFPHLKYLVVVLKQFMLQRQLNEVFTGGISSYCLIMLVISFLQLHPRLDATSEKANLGVLLTEFFELYGTSFNYVKTGIRIKGNGQYLPRDYNGQAMLFVEDPLISDDDSIYLSPHAANIARGSYGFQMIQKACEYAYFLLRDMVSPNKMHRFSTHDGSSLSLILSVSDDVVKHRKFIQKLYGDPCHISLPLQPAQQQQSSQSIPGEPPVYIGTFPMSINTPASTAQPTCFTVATPIAPSAVVSDTKVSSPASSVHSDTDSDSVIVQQSGHRHCKHNVASPLTTAQNPAPHQGSNDGGNDEDEDDEVDDCGGDDDDVRSVASTTSRTSIRSNSSNASSSSSGSNSSSNGGGSVGSYNRSNASSRASSIGSNSSTSSGNKSYVEAVTRRSPVSSRTKRPPVVMPPQAVPVPCPDVIIAGIGAPGIPPAAISVGSAVATMPAVTTAAVSVKNYNKPTTSVPQHRHTAPTHTLPHSQPTHVVVSLPPQSQHTGTTAPQNPPVSVPPAAASVGSVSIHHSPCSAQHPPAPTHAPAPTLSSHQPSHHYQQRHTVTFTNSNYAAKQQHGGYAMQNSTATNNGSKNTQHNRPRHNQKRRKNTHSSNPLNKR